MSQDLGAAADRLQAQRSSTFTRRRTLDDNEDGSGMVHRAVARAKEGDREAIRYLYLKYADNVFGYVRSIVRDDHEAEDVTQNVFAKLMTVIGKYERRSCPFSAWILRVARNVAVDQMRQADVRRTIPCEEVRGADQRSDETGRERTQCIQEAMESVPEDQRQVLMLRHLVGLTPGEIAEQLGRSEGSVHGLHHRGRRTIQAALVGLDAAPALRPSG